ncbi:MAG: hypothetical protein ACR2J8_06825 [Thermomicrobiales bacterium]
MDHKSFDRLAMLAGRLKETKNRRGALALLLGGLVGATGAIDADARNNHHNNWKCRGYGQYCDNHYKCCQGRCRYNRCYPGSGGGGGGNNNKGCGPTGFDCPNGWRCCGNGINGVCTPNGYGTCCGGNGFVSGWTCCKNNGSGYYGACPAGSRCCSGGAGSGCCPSGFSCCNNGQCCPDSMRCTNQGCMPWGVWSESGDGSGATPVPFTPRIAIPDGVSAPLMTELPE